MLWPQPEKKGKRLPKPGSRELLVVLSKTPEVASEKIPGRVYIDRNGVEHPWMYEGNSALWLGQNEDED